MTLARAAEQAIKPLNGLGTTGSSPVKNSWSRAGKGCYLDITFNAWSFPSASSRAFSVILDIDPSSKARLWAKSLSWRLKPELQITAAHFKVSRLVLSAGLTQQRGLLPVSFGSRAALPVAAHHQWRKERGNRCEKPNNNEASQSPANKRPRAPSDTDMGSANIFSALTIKSISFPISYLPLFIFLLTGLTRTPYCASFPFLFPV